jgi:cobalamin biosynthesis protein CbiG
MERIRRPKSKKRMKNLDRNDLVLENKKFVTAEEMIFLAQEGMSIDTEKMNIGIVGSRDLTDDAKIKELILTTLQEEGIDINKIKNVVSGGATGVDGLAKQFADDYKINFIEFVPEWEKFGKSAGVQRNKEIVSNSDFVIIFQKGDSKGTQSSLNLCKKLGVNYKLFKF